MKFVLAVAEYGAPVRAHQEAVAELKALCGPNMVQVVARGLPYICMARALLVAMAEPELERLGASHIFWLDHDIVFDPRALLDTLESCDKEHPIVGGLYAMRQAGGKLIGTIHPDHQQVECLKNGRLYRAHPRSGVGMGFCAVRHEVYAELKKHLPLCPLGFDDRLVYPYYALEASTEGYFGEDYSFCRLARKHGFETWADTRARLLHTTGDYNYALEDTMCLVPRYDSLTLLNGPDSIKMPIAPNVTRDEHGRAHIVQPPPPAAAE